jgi:hypothetical protein
MKVFFALVIATLVSTKAYAGLIEASFTFDGSKLTQQSGIDIFANEFNVGDTLTLTFSAAEPGSYWDFSGINRSYGFDLGFTESAYREVDGDYNFTYEGTSIKLARYYYITSCCDHAGPDSISFDGTKLFDSLTISYRMFISDAATNMLSGIDDSASYSIWNTLSNSSTFVNPNATEVSEPHNLLLLMLSALGLVAFRRVKR